MSDTFRKMRNYVTGGDNEEDRGFVEEVKSDLDCCKSMSWATRIKGFIICLAIGIVLSILGTIMFWVSLTAFAILYSLGTITSIASSFFLMGPLRQLKKMVDPNRLIATIVMIISIALTFCAAFWWKVGALCLVFVVIQLLAFTWYCLSYIPYARDCVIKAATSCC
ncbi:vesicle transport protein SFT2B-like [Oscarella lobularis]|uniref:vesicle transport protein SFT2B-like n=1 Tax=Oscarella lobularis TaxID=121494 RepID=UPI003313785B